MEHSTTPIQIPDKDKLRNTVERLRRDRNIKAFARHAWRARGRSWIEGQLRRHERDYQRIAAGGALVFANPREDQLRHFLSQIAWCIAVLSLMTDLDRWARSADDQLRAANDDWPDRLETWRVVSGHGGGAPPPEKGNGGPLQPPPLGFGFARIGLHTDTGTTPQAQEPKAPDGVPCAWGLP